MNTHNTLAEDMYDSICDIIRISEMIFPGKGERDLRVGLSDVDDDMRVTLLKQAENYLDTDYPVLLLSDYRRFSADGNRAYYEEKYFLRRRMLTTLTLAECVEGKGRFLDKILDGLYLILEETTWCIPAHNTYIRDEKQLELPDEDRPIIDLFAAETAEIVGLTESLLRDALAKVSPYISGYVDREIRKRVLTPYLTYHFWWMGNGLEPMCNWTPWITQNILLALFSRKQGFMTEDEAHRALKQAVSSVDYFLDEYGEDGCCDEGAQYYSHAGLCLFGCIDVLNRITDDAFVSMYEDDLIENIAAYIVKMYVGDGYYINFADCSPFPGHRDVRDYLFAVHTHNDAYAAFTAQDYRRLSSADRLAFDEQNLYYHLLTLMYHRELMEYDGQYDTPDDSYFPSVGLMIARDGHYTLAVKAGNNGDSHNHNDVGSITLYKDNRPFLIDLGVETYTAKTFSPDRYDIWIMQSAYHNTVNFISGDSKDRLPDICQHDGERYGAAKAEVSLAEDHAHMSFDIAGAYDDKRIVSVMREVTFDKGREIRIEDRVDTEAGIRPVMTLMSYEKPRLLSDVSHDGMMRIGIGDLGVMDVCGMADIAIDTCPITDGRLQIAWKHDCYRILLYPAGIASTVVITCC